MTYPTTTPTAEAGHDYSPSTSYLLLTSRLTQVDNSLFSVMTIT